MYLENIGASAKKASRIMARLGQAEKNNALLKVAKDLLAHKSEIISANEIDVENGRKNHKLPQCAFQKEQQGTTL